MDKSLIVRRVQNFPNQVILVVDDQQLTGDEQKPHHEFIEQLLDRAWSLGISKGSIIEIEVTLVPGLKLGIAHRIEFRIGLDYPGPETNIQVFSSITVTRDTNKYLHQRQAISHDPENGKWGDCHRTAIAMVLGIDMCDVPAPNAEVMESNEAFNALYDQWYKDNGYAAFSIGISASSVGEAIKVCNGFANSHGRNLPYILGGASARGCNHSVAILEGRVYDPHPSNEGLVGPLISSDDHYHMTVILKPSRL